MEAWTHKPIARFTADGCTVKYEEYDETTKSVVREVGVRNMMIERRLLELLKRLQDRNVPAIVMKGCHLIHRVYPFGIRPIEDIDLLMDRRHFAAADEAVRELDYDDTAVSMDVWTHLEVSNKMTYMNRTHPKIPIDYHFTLGPYPYLGRIPFDVLLRHSEKLESKGVSFLVLQREMLMVHLLLHLYQHHDEHWQVSAYDLCTITTLDEAKLDWDRFLAIVKAYSLQLPVLHALAKAASLVKVGIPERVTEALRALPTTRRERRIFRASQTMVSGMEKHVVQFLTLPGLGVKLRALRRICFPPRSFLRNYHRGSYVRYLAAMSSTAAGALWRSRR